MHLSLKSALTVILCTLMLSLGAQGWFALHSISKINAGTVDIASNWLPSVRVLGEIKYRVSRLRLLDARYTMGTESLEDLAKPEAERVKAVAESLRDYDPLVSSPEERVLATQITELYAQYDGLRRQFPAFLRAGDARSAQKLFDSTRPLFEQLVKALEQDAELNTRGSQIARVTAEKVYDSAYLTTILVCGGAVLLGLGVARVGEVFQRVPRGRNCARQPPRDRGKRREGGRRSAARGTEHEEVAVANGMPRGRAAALLLRDVQQAEAPWGLGGSDHGRQGLAPRAPRGRGARPAGRDAIHIGAAGEGELHDARLGVRWGEDPPASRPRGNFRCGIRADHGSAVWAVVDAQRDAQVGVRQHGIAHDSRGALGAQDEVHPEGATPRGHIDEQGVQVGMLSEHGSELVDHDHQARQAGDIADAPAARVGDRTLPVAQLSTKARESARGARLIEIGHDADRVRKSLELRERRPALEVDEQHGEPFRRGTRGHRKHPRDEQLALAAARRATDHRVRSLCDEIDHDRTRCVKPDGTREPGCALDAGQAREGNDIRYYRNGRDEPLVLGRTGHRDRPGVRALDGDQTRAHRSSPLPIRVLHDRGAVGRESDDDAALAREGCLDRSDGDERARHVLTAATELCKHTVPQPTRDGVGQARSPQVARRAPVSRRRERPGELHD